jgi:hypothetical protein
MPTSDRPPPDRNPADDPGDPIELVRRSLERLRFGAIQLTVHEGRLVQIDITEKRRFAS